MALKAGYHGIKNIKSSQIMLRSEQEILGAKNLLENKAVSGTRGTITITVNADKSITLSAGTSATSDSAPEINASVPLKKGKYIITSGVVNNDFFMRVVVGGTGTNLTTGIMTFDLANDANIEVRLFLKANKTLAAPITFYPMIRLASDPDKTYVPYAMTNRELTGSVQMLTKAAVKSDTFSKTTSSGGNAQLYAGTSRIILAVQVGGFIAIPYNTGGENPNQNVHVQNTAGSPIADTAITGTYYYIDAPAAVTRSAASPETRSDVQELTEEEPAVKKTTRKATKKTEEV